MIALRFFLYTETLYEIHFSLFDEFTEIYTDYNNFELHINYVVTIITTLI